MYNKRSTPNLTKTSTISHFAFHSHIWSLSLFNFFFLHWVRLVACPILQSLGHLVLLKRCIYFPWCFDFVFQTFLQMYLLLVVELVIIVFLYNLFLNFISFTHELIIYAPLIIHHISNLFSLFSLVMQKHLHYMWAHDLKKQICIVLENVIN